MVTSGVHNVALCGPPSIAKALILHRVIGVRPDDSMWVLAKAGQARACPSHQTAIHNTVSADSFSSPTSGGTDLTTAACPRRPRRTSWGNAPPDSVGIADG